MVVCAANDSPQKFDNTRVADAVSNAEGMLTASAYRPEPSAPLYPPQKVIAFATVYAPAVPVCINQ